MLIEQFHIQNTVRYNIHKSNSSSRQELSPFLRVRATILISYNKWVRTKVKMSTLLRLFTEKKIPKKI